MFCNNENSTNFNFVTLRKTRGKLNTIVEDKESFWRATHEQEEIFKWALRDLSESTKLKDRSRFKRSSQIVARINRRLSSISRWANEPDAEILNTHQMVNISIQYWWSFNGMKKSRSRSSSSPRHVNEIGLSVQMLDIVQISIHVASRECVSNIMPTLLPAFCLKNRTLDILIDDSIRVCTSSNVPNILLYRSF